MKILVAAMLMCAAERISQPEELYGVLKHVSSMLPLPPGVEIFTFECDGVAMTTSIESQLINAPVTLDELRTSLSFGMPLSELKLLHAMRNVGRRMHNIATEQLKGLQVVRDVPREIAELVLPVVEVFPPAWAIHNAHRASGGSPARQPIGSCAVATRARAGLTSSRVRRSCEGKSTVSRRASSAISARVSRGMVCVCSSVGRRVRLMN